MTRHKRAKDGLAVHLLNLSAGGASTPKLRDTSYPDPADASTMIDQKKKCNSQMELIRAWKLYILRERKKWSVSGLKKLCFYCRTNTQLDPVYTLENFCATYVSSQEPDFLAQKEELTEMVESVEFKIIFYPKFHCELNFIELC